MNKISKYLEKSGVTKSEFARRISVTPGMVFQLARGDLLPSEKLSVRIELATGGALKRQDLRPNDWAEIWPELNAPSQPCCANETSHA